jgi:hypothetical protein
MHDARERVEPEADQLAYCATILSSLEVQQNVKALPSFDDHSIRVMEHAADLLLLVQVRWH